MRTKTSFVLLCAGILITVMAVATRPQPAIAQNQTCYDNQGMPISCTPPPAGSTDQPSGKKRPTKTPVNAPILILTKTGTPTVTQFPTDTASPTLLVSATPTETLAAPTSSPTAALATASPTGVILAPVRTAGPPATPPSVLCLLCPHPSGLLIALAGGLLLLGLLAIGLLISLLFTGPLSLGPAGQPGGGSPLPGGNENWTVRPHEGDLPAIQRGGYESATIGGRDMGDFRGGNESNTIPVRDVGDFGGGNESATVSHRDIGDFGGGNESATMTVREPGDFGGGNESATMTVRDAGDVAPDVIRSAREAASDPGGAQINANPGGAHLGDTPGGGH